MKLLLTARHFTVTPALRQLVNRRLARLERVLNDRLVSIQVILTLRKAAHRADITVHARGDHVLHGVAEGSAWSPALTLAVDKVLHQGRRLKGKWEERKRRAPRVKERAATDASKVAPTPPEPARSAIRRTRYAVKPMSVEDAAERIEQVSDGFLVFRNEATDAINIVYRLKDGDVGLIDPDA